MHSLSIQKYFEQIYIYYKDIDSLSVKQEYKLIKAVLYTITYKDLPLEESHELIFYISSTVIKIKEFTEIIRDPTKFILDLKATYKIIKKIRYSEGSTKGKEIITS